MVRSQLAVSLFVGLLGLAGCGDDDGPSGTFRCTDNAGCDDDIACTVDSCGVDGNCSRTPIHERCGAGERCDLVRGCVGSCMRNEDCNDGVECTLDTCAVGGICQATPLNERCPAGQACSATGCGTGMMDAGAGTCTSSAQCDDRIDCTLDSCGADMRCQHIGQSSRCAMGQMCNPSSGCSMQCEGPEECQDGVLCNGVETCDPEFGCAPAELPEDCEDGDPCTINARCDTASDTCVDDCNTADPSCADHPRCVMPPVEMFPATYDIVPTIEDACFEGLPIMGSPYFTINQLRFELLAGPVLTATALPMERMGCRLTQIPAPTDASFDMRCDVLGGCNERLRLMGRFVGADRIEATFTATYDGSCGEELGFLICSAVSVTFVGTRRP